MNRIDFLKRTTFSGLGLLTASPTNLFQPPKKVTRKIFATGGGYDQATLTYLIKLTGKTNPKICFMPTPVGDNEVYIRKWFDIAKTLPIQPFVQKVFIASSEQVAPFADTLLNMDAILVTGGNTLNAIALWRAHGIDELLRQAWEKGIVLSGPSAGSICWFEEGLSDSRPTRLSRVRGLGFLKGSNCPHYHTEASRRPLYLSLIKEGSLMPGYACDETAGLYFENDSLRAVVSQKSTDAAYRVSVRQGKPLEEKLETTVLLTT